MKSTVVVVVEHTSVMTGKTRLEPFGKSQYRLVFFHRHLDLNALGELRHSLGLDDFVLGDDSVQAADSRIV